MNIPLVDIKAQYESIQDDIDSKVQEVLHSGQFILGPYVQKLEEEIAAYCNTRFAIGVASGTDALLLSLKALGVGPGDDVIIPPFTFFATGGAVHNAGARIIFCDIDEETFNIDTEKLEEKITIKTKAIIPVHLFGQCADMAPIRDLALTHNIHVIEDAAQSIGALYNGKKAGSMGDTGCISFFPTKNLGGYGDGGMVVTSQEHVAKRLSMLRVHGEEKRYYHAEIGINSRLDGLQAGIISAKLPHLEGWSEKRRQNAAKYNELFANSVVRTPVIHEKNVSIYNQYTIRLNNRDEVMQHLQSKGIACAVYYPKPLHIQECFSYLDYKPGDCPVSEKAAEEVLSLPIFPELTDGQIETVAKAVLEVAR